MVPGHCLHGGAIMMLITHSYRNSVADKTCGGCINMQMATGRVPRSEIPPMRLLFVIVQEPAPKLEGNFSDGMKSFVAQCLEKNPEKRPTAIDLLMHPFVTQAEKTQEVLERIRWVIHQDKGEKSVENNVKMNVHDVTLTDHDSASEDLCKSSHPKLNVAKPAQAEESNIWANLSSMANTVSKGTNLDRLKSILRQRERSEVQQSEDLGPLGKYIMRQFLRQ